MEGGRGDRKRETRNAVRQALTPVGLSNSILVAGKYKEEREGGREGREGGRGGWGGWRG